jgi:hypothetical protein
MAALNFPDPNVTTSYTNPDTGITYEWANGVWKSVSSALTAPELFVDVEGDNLTGNLTLGTDKIVLNATDGSASFAADVQIGENLGNAQSNTGGIFNLPDGRTILYHSSSETSPFIKCSKHDGITGSDVVTINDNGSATFAGSVQAGDLSVTVDNKNGSEIGSDGVLTLQRQSSVGSGNAIQIFQGAGTQPTTKIGADGSSSFAGYVNVGNYVTGTGIRLNDWGEVISRVDGAKSAAFSAYQNGLAAGNVKARIYNDGSAEFASAVTVGPGNPSNGSNDGTILYGSGGLGVSKSSGALITFNQTGSGSTGQINADGSATFAGPQTLGTPSSPATNGYTSHVDNTEASTAACFSANNHNAHGINFLGVDGGNGNEITSKIMNDGSVWFARGNFQMDTAGVIQTNLYSAGTLNIDSSGSFGSPKIVLNASNGNATFSGSVESKNNFFVNAVVDDQTCFRTIRNGVNTSYINGDGSATFAGTIKSTTWPTTGYEIESSGALGLNAAAGTSGNMFALNVGGTQVASITGQGIATFAGSITAAGYDLSNLQELV